MLTTKEEKQTALAIASMLKIEADNYKKEGDPLLREIISTILYSQVATIESWFKLKPTVHKPLCCNKVGLAENCSICQKVVLKEVPVPLPPFTPEKS